MCSITASSRKSHCFRLLFKLIQLLYLLRLSSLPAPVLHLLKHGDQAAEDLEGTRLDAYTHAYIRTGIRTRMSTTSIFCFIRCLDEPPACILHQMLAPSHRAQCYSIGSTRGLLGHFVCSHSLLEPC